MAKYFSRKIHIAYLQPMRSFSNRLELIPQSNRMTAAPTSEDIAGDLSEESGGQAIRYNVCRERGGSKKFVFEKRPRLPEDTAEQQSETETETHHILQQPTTIAQKGYRTFDVSTTQKNITLPLKLSKLANPFPEPVKVMPSHTVSDQDKADQAQAEFRVPRSITRKARI